MSITILKVTVMVPIEVKAFVMEFAFVLTRKKNKGNIFTRRQSVRAESVSYQQFSKNKSSPCCKDKKSIILLISSLDPRTSSQFALILWSSECIYLSDPWHWPQVGKGWHLWDNVLALLINRPELPQIIADNRACSTTAFLLASW